eukprot:s1035_g11.t1
MAREVRMYDRTLLEAIDEGIVPRPPLLTYQEWNAWRAREGQRPSRRRHGDQEITTTTAEEAQLWRKVMATLYGEDWQDQLAMAGGALEESDEETAKEEEEEQEAVEDVPAASGADLALVPAHARAKSAASSSVGGESVFQDMSSSHRLQEGFLKEFVPGAETARRFGKRLRGIADALGVFGEMIDEESVERRVIRALYLEKIHGADSPSQLAMLKEFFQELVLDEPPEEQEEEHERRVGILLEMIQERGGQLSKSAQKLFSSSEGSPEKGHEGPKDGGFTTPQGQKFKGDRPTAGKGRGKDRSREPRRNSQQQDERSEVEMLKKRLLELEGDVRSEASRPFDASAFAEVLEKQTKAMTEALTRKSKRSTIQVTPKISWPMLDDECSDYRSVQEFYDTFEATIGLANDGDGMTDIEKLTTLKACLKQHRLKTYELVYRRQLGTGLVQSDPGQVYEQIKSKHLLFSETAEERQIRVLEEGDALEKGKLSAFQWEVRWESDGKGGTIFRGVETWEEAHEVVKEIEETNAGQRALNNSTFVHGLEKEKPKKEKKPDKVLAQGSELIEPSKLKQVCFDTRDRGTCSKGKDCRYLHDKAVVEEARKKALRDKKSADSQEKVSKHSSYRDDAKKEGKGAGKKGGKNKKDQPQEGEKKACRFYNTAGGCSRGSKCPFLHEGPGGSRGAGPGLQLVNVPELSGVGGKGSAAMAEENPFVGCFETAVVEEHFDGPVVQDPVKWWKEAENSKGGYQYQTEVKILDKYVGCLLDGCAGRDSATEELVVGVKAALRNNVPPDSPKFPVAQFESWPKEEVVMGLANGAPIKLTGVAVLRVAFLDVGGKKDREILVRAKVIAKGCSTWHGLILGGRALDAVERGGLGYRPGANAHIFDALGVRLPRKEETEEYADHAYPHVAVLKSLFDRAWDGKDEDGEGEEVEGEVLICAGQGQWVGEEGDWVPVRRQLPMDTTSKEEVTDHELSVSPVHAVLPLAGSSVEAVPGLWDQRSAAGHVYVIPKESDAFLGEGTPVAAIVERVAEQKFCRRCGHFDAAACVGKRGKPCPCQKGNLAEDDLCSRCQAKVGESIYHIVETPGALDLLAEEGPTDEYYDRLRKHMGAKYPNASEHLLDHLEALESFLDRSIAAGVTFGIDKASIAVVEGELLGHTIGRFGAKCNAEKTKAILNFPALREKLHIQQFLGCTNFLRMYLPPEYAHCAKLLGEYVKGAKAFPEDGLGPGTSEGDLAVRAIKLMAQRSIELAVLDEAAAVSGERPLEQIADSRLPDVLPSYSRNPEDRDQLLAQRTKDLAGLIGQLRGFDLEEFLSDASADEALAWSVGEDALPDKLGQEIKSTESPVAACVAHLKTSSQEARNNMFAAGVSSDLKVLYVPDYVHQSERMTKTSEISRALRTVFPECNVKVALAEPPFEDTEGTGCHFEKQGKQKLTGKKLANDLLTSVATLLREVARLNPSFVVGAGQGGIVALAAASPVVVEAVLLARDSVAETAFRANAGCYTQGQSSRPTSRQQRSC